MVDRIVPATTDRERQLVKDNFGIIDELPVVCEPFRQWVIEDNFIWAASFRKGQVNL